MTKVYILGTHEYQWCLFPFAYLFQKYWSNDKITYVADRLESDLPDNVTYMQVPAYREGIWDWKHTFSNGLLSLLDAVMDERFIIIMFPDQWLNAKVDKKGINVLRDYMRKNQLVIRANLAQGTKYDALGQHFKTIKRHKITTILSGNPHAGLEAGIAFVPSLWNVKLLRDIFEPGWNLWQCETVGSQKVTQWRVEDEPLMTIGTNPALLSKANVLSRHHKKQVSLSRLSTEDKEIVKRYIPENWTSA